MTETAGPDQITTPLEDHDPNLIISNLAFLGVPEAESDLEKSFNIKDVNIENLDAALDGLYDAYKLNITGEVLQYTLGMIPIAIEHAEARQDGVITPDEKFIISEKIKELEETVPNAAKRYSIQPISAGGQSTTADIVTNVETKADPDEAFSLRLTFNTESQSITFSFSEPIDPANIQTHEKISYILDELDIDKAQAIKAMESDTQPEFIKTLESAIENANSKFDDNFELTPNLLLTEMKIEAEQEATAAAQTTPKHEHDVETHAAVEPSMGQR